MAVSTPTCEFGWNAPAFSLPATDGKTYSLHDIAGERATLVMFICNHCPFVKGVIDRIVEDANALKAVGVSTVAINANDARSHPEDSFEKMVAFASQNNFAFPYLHDESQEVARAYDAVCTPDFFGFNRDLALQYRGRLDSAGKNPTDAETTRDLLSAMKLIAETRRGPKQQFPSMGCSIKWKP